MKSTYDIQSYGGESSANEQQIQRPHDETTPPTLRSQSAAAQAEAQQRTRRNDNDLFHTIRFSEYSLSLLESRPIQRPNFCLCSNDVVQKERGSTTSIAGGTTTQQYLIDILDDVLAILEEDSDDCS